MYTTIVRRIVRSGFRALSAGNYEQVLRQFHPQVIFSFIGPAPLGGERRGWELPENGSNVCSPTSQASSSLSVM